MLKEESTTTSVLELGSNNNSSKKWAHARSPDRAWVCEACESAPAAFLCKADAASLCVACDAEIHSANPLARRHHRVPIVPVAVAGFPYGSPPAAVDPDAGGGDDGFLTHDGVELDDEDDQDEASSWLLLNPVKHNGNGGNNPIGTGFLFGGEVVDEYLDLEEYNSGQENNQQCTEEYNNNHQQVQSEYGNVVLVPQKSYGGDSVVPVQSVDTKGGQIQHQQYLSYQMEMEYENPKTGYGYPASISHSVSRSSMDVGVVPESTISDVSISNPRPPKGTIELFSSPPVHMATQLTPMDREARVLRYREKKKTRKFEKTIRYASRKAYAETRPRIKGRFAKRTDVDVEVDQIFSTALMADGGYGIVPSF